MLVTRKEHETLMRYLLICYEILKEILLYACREYEIKHETLRKYLLHCYKILDLNIVIS